MVSKPTVAIGPMMAAIRPASVRPVPVDDGREMGADVSAEVEVEEGIAVVMMLEVVVTVDGTEDVREGTFDISETVKLCPVSNFSCVMVSNTL